MSDSTSKVAILDSARGVCAFIIALYHFLFFESPQGTLFDPNNRFLKTIGDFMPGTISVFFLISGYVIYLHLERSNFQLKDFGRFMLRRIIRLQVPLLACVLLILAINGMFALYNGVPLDFSWSQFVANISLTANFASEKWYNDIFWTLAIELQFYLFIGLTFLLIRNHLFQWLLGLGIVAFALNYCFDTRGIFVEFASYFIIGIAMYRFHQNKFALWQVSILVIIGIVDFQLNQQFHYYLSSVLFIPIILFVNKRSRILEFAGEISFSFYLIHGAVGGLFLYFTARHANQIWSKIALLLFALLISYFAAYLFYRLIEKTSAGLVKTISYKRKSDLTETN